MDGCWSGLRCSARQGVMAKGWIQAPLLAECTSSCLSLKLRKIFSIKLWVYTFRFCSRRMRVRRAGLYTPFYQWYAGWEVFPLLNTSVILLVPCWIWPPAWRSTCTIWLQWIKTKDCPFLLSRDHIALSSLLILVSLILKRNPWIKYSTSGSVGFNPWPTDGCCFGLCCKPALVI